MKGKIASLAFSSLVLAVVATFSLVSQNTISYEKNERPQISFYQM